MSLKLVTPPATEPVTATEAKLHARIDTSADDALVTAAIVAARQWCEQVTSRAFITQTWRLRRDAFPAGRTLPIRLPKPPTISIAHVKYTDSDGALQTWGASNYTLDADEEPARLFPAYDVDWPDTRAIPAAVEVQYSAGYGAASDVPQAIKQAILLTVADFYENRAGLAGASIKAALSLLRPFIVKRFDS